MSALSALDRRRVVRLVAAGVVILAFVVLATFAILASRSDFSVSLGRPSAAADAPPAALPEVPSLASFTSPAPRLTTRTVNVPVAGAPAVAPLVTTTTLAPPPVLDAAEQRSAPCALGLPPADTSAGLANLIGAVPLFGVFSPEAFAFLPIMEPMLAAGSPLLPVVEQFIALGQPVIDVLTPVVQTFGEAGLQTLLPLYGPVRPEVLEGFTQLAEAIKPALVTITTAPGSECALALEGQLAQVLGGLLPPANP